MDEIFERTRWLARSIAESGMNAEYKSALTKLKANPELVEQMRQFKRLQLEYSADGEPTFDQQKHLSKLYFDLRMNPVAKHFLECEKRLLALMLDIQDRLWKDCDISLEFIK